MLFWLELLIVVYYYFDVIRVCGLGVVWVWVCAFGCGLYYWMFALSFIAWFVDFGFWSYWVYDFGCVCLAGCFCWRGFRFCSPWGDCE